MRADSPVAFLEAFHRLRLPFTRPAVPSSVFMVMPEQFHVDEESAIDNPYMRIDSPADPDRALAQAMALADLVESTGVPVRRFPGRADQPDGIFPNNVFATCAGRFIVGAMRHSGRQKEAGRADIRDHFRDRDLVDLSGQSLIAELTGALIIDRGRGIGFCGRTGRVDDAGIDAMAKAFDLPLMFGFDLDSSEYHTNVVMSVLASRACVIAPDAFPDPAVVDAISEVYENRTLKLTEEEKLAFAGNCIALTDRDLFMSATGVRALDPARRALLEQWGFRIHGAELDEIEKAGGSLRCMIAEVF